jgi:hypothetical protein
MSSLKPSDAHRIKQPAKATKITEGLIGRWLLTRQKKQHPQSPDAENQPADAPCNGSPAAVGCNYRTKNRVEAMNQCYRSVKRNRFYIGLDKEKTGEIAEKMIEIHQ